MSKRGANIPHRIMLYGKPWDVRWYDPAMDENSAEWTKNQLAQADFESNTIRIAARLRYDLQQAWENLIHEILHIIDENEGDWRKHHEALTRRDRSATLKWKKLESKRHDEKGEGDTIYRLDLALGRMFADNLVTVACCCTKCFRKRMRKEQEEGE